MTEQQARIVECSDVASTRWLKLQTLTYQDAEGSSRKWDMATRTTRQPGAEIDGVAILALLKRRGDPASVEMLLVQQYRPPVDAVTVELPAGLIDPGETAETAAVRELQEETGFLGSVSSSSGRLCMSPGMVDECVKLVVVEVDLDAPANVAPEQKLDESEFIDVVRVPVRELLPSLRTMEEQGKVPFVGLYGLAVGLQLMDQA